jgi:hypothetical protein
MEWRHPWHSGQSTRWAVFIEERNLQHVTLLSLECRHCTSNFCGAPQHDAAHACCRQHAPIPPPPHPTFDLHACVRLALEEDAGKLGDVTTLATYAAAMRAPALAVMLSHGNGCCSCPPALLPSWNTKFTAVHPRLHAAAGWQQVRRRRRPLSPRRMGCSRASLSLMR